MQDLIDLAQWYDQNKDIVNHFAGVNGPIGLIGLAYLVKAVLRIEKSFAALSERVGRLEVNIEKLNEKLADIVGQVRANRQDIEHWLFTE